MISDRHIQIINDKILGKDRKTMKTTVDYRIVRNDGPQIMIMDWGHQFVYIDSIDGLILSILWFLVPSLLLSLYIINKQVYQPLIYNKCFYIVLYIVMADQYDEVEVDDDFENQFLADFEAQ